MEQTGDHGGGGEHLRHDADEDTDEKKDGADGLSLATIFTCHNLQERSATAASDGVGVD